MSVQNCQGTGIKPVSTKDFVNNLNNLSHNSILYVDTRKKLCKN